MSVRYCNQEKQFSSRQITAMLFTKLKIIAEAALKIKVDDSGSILGLSWGIGNQYCHILANIYLTII